MNLILQILQMIPLTSVTLKLQVVALRSKIASESNVTVIEFSYC